ncbi:MAG TPA: 7TM-DISM domain-containing protein [Prolixibacteraceae bacterium]|nr:7TM-DISM domain-containing protein [Prolixibacteraceae bacterium]
MNRFHLLLLFSLCSVNVIAGADTLIIRDPEAGYRISEYLSYYIDYSSVATLNRVAGNAFSDQFKKVNQRIPNLGVSNHPHWFKFHVKNQSNLQQWILEIDYPTLEEVVFYVLNADGSLDTTIYTGKNPIYSPDPTYTSSVSFQQTLLTGKSYTIFVRVRTNSYIILPLMVMSPKTFISKDRKKNFFLNSLFGILLGLIIFNFILFLLTHERNYLLLTLYLAVLSLNAYYMYGIGFDIFTDIGPFLKSRMRHLLFGLGSILFMLFTINYLDLKRYRKLYYLIVALIILGILYTVVLFIESINHSLFSQYSSPLFFVGSTICFFGGIYSFLKGEKMAIYYIISFSVIAVSSVFYLLTLSNVLSFNWFSFYINIYATILFGFLLTIGLMEKITRIRQEKAKSHYFEQMTFRLTQEVQERKQIEKALRDSEERFRLLFELSPQPISLTEMETGMIIDVNHQIVLMTGYSKAELIGKTSLDLEIISSVDRDRLLNSMKESPRILGFEMDLHTKNGTVNHCLIYSQPIKSEQARF